MVPAALLTLCLLFQSAPPPGEPVARVEGKSWSRAEFGEWLVARHGVPILYDFVSEQVILIEAGKRGLLPGEADLAAAYEREHAHIIEAAYSGDEAKWEREQVQRGYTPESARQRRMGQMRAELALENMVRADRDLSDEQVLQRFHEQFGEAGERVAVEVLYFSAYRDVVPGTKLDPPALKRAARERAEQVRAAWQAGGQLSALLPQSDGTGRDFIVEGAIAEYRPRLLGKDIDEAVAALDDPGDISQPIDSFDGVWLLRLVSRESVTPEQVHDQLVTELREAPIESGESNTARNALMEAYKPELLLH